MVLGLPVANIKLADVVTALGQVDTSIAGLTARIAALEANVQRNDQRIAAVEVFVEEHRAGAARRQAEVNRITLENARLRQALAQRPPA